MFDAVIYAQHARLSAWASDVIARSKAPIRYEPPAIYSPP